MKIILGNAQSLIQQKNDVLESMFGLRHQVFYERLGWDVGSYQGLEMDRFDTLNPTYMVACGEASTVQGCCRLLACNAGSYMLKDHFSELLRGEPAPSESTVWELSRFAVRVPMNSQLSSVTFSPAAFTMIRALYDFSIANGISHIVTVTSVAMERLLIKMGLPVRRFGDRRALKIGKVLSVAVWIEINARFYDTVYLPAHKECVWGEAA